MIINNVMMTLAKHPMLTWWAWVWYSALVVGLVQCVILRIMNTRCVSGRCDVAIRVMMKTITLTCIVVLTFGTTTLINAIMWMV